MRQSEIREAEGQKQALILAAEGRKEAAFRDAEARERAAEAEAKATAAVSTAIAAGDVQAINYFVALKYVEALKEMAHSPNQKVLMMPVDATSILGSIAGIAEIAKAANSAAARPASPTPAADRSQTPGRFVMLELLETLFLRYGAWSWWVLGLILLGLELFVPGFVLVWFGVAAILVGLLALIVDWPVQTLALIWAGVSIVLLLVGRRWFVASAAHSADPLLNDRAGRLIGRVFTLAEPLTENGGRLVVDDSVWRITGPLLPVGTKVVVKAAQGTTLVVAPTAA
jgi:hypothetical protein